MILCIWSGHYVSEMSSASSINDVNDLGHAAGIADMMIALCGCVVACPVAKRLLERIILQLASVAAENVPTISGMNPMKETYFRHGPRAARFDEDYVHHVMEELPQRRGVSSGSAAIAVDDSVADESRSRDWQNAKVSRYIESSWYAVEKHGPLQGTVGMCEDGARLGRPAH